LIFPEKTLYFKYLMDLKTLIEVDRRTWGKVKDVATVNAVPVGSVAGIILSYALGTHKIEDKKRPPKSDIITQYGNLTYNGLAELTRPNKNRQTDFITGQPDRYLVHEVP
jgi:hypothetical protein